ncbi:hypothetical protein Ancab_022111 [Ancistrocladus abbreviatus]
MVKKMESPKLISLELIQLHSLLQSLMVSDDVELASFPLGVLPKLRTLSFQRLQCLEELERQGWSSVECFLEKGSLPRTLQRLKIKEAPNLKRLDREDLQTLKYLESLIIDHCPLLLAMLEEGVPHSLSWLYIKNFDPVLKEQCERDIGPDWPKISHIQGIYIYPQKGSQE